MQLNQNGDVLIHKKTWDIVKNNSYYSEIADMIEDLEAHYDSMNDPSNVSLEDYLKKRDSLV